MFKTNISILLILSLLHRNKPDFQQVNIQQNDQKYTYEQDYLLKFLHGNCWFFLKV